jgi:hypothetical protein
MKPPAVNVLALSIDQCPIHSRSARRRRRGDGKSLAIGDHKYADTQSATGELRGITAPYPSSTFSEYSVIKVPLGDT